MSLSFLRNRDILFPTLLGTFVLLSRIAGAENSPLLWDAGSFHLAATDYDIGQDRPHLPGYYLHVQLLRFFRLFLPEYHANVAVPVLWSLAGIVLLYILIRRFAAERESFFAGLLMATNPMLWFFGCVSEIYAFDFFFSIALLALGLRGRWLHLSPLFMAFAAGVRPSSPVLLLPLYGWLWYCALRDKRYTGREFALWHGVALLPLLGWLLPLLQTCGGWEAYFQLYHSHNPMLKASPLQNIGVMLSYALYTLPAFFLLWLCALPLKKNDMFPSPFTKQEGIAFALWIGVPLLFFVIVLYGKGYALLFLGALPLVLLRSLRRLSSVVVYGIAAVQYALYLFTPYIVPDLMIWQRGGSVLSKAKERTFSVYSLTQAHINTMNMLHLQIDSALALHTAPYIMVDPTFPLSPRVLQVRHQDIQFASILVRDSGMVQVYKGISLRHSNTLRQILDSSLILTTRQCHDRYFAKILAPVWQHDNLMLCTPLPVADSTESVESIYRRMFVY